MLYPGCPHIFTGLEYSGASVRGHTYFPVVQCIGLEYSVLVKPELKCATLTQEKLLKVKTLAETTRNETRNTTNKIPILAGPDQLKVSKGSYATRTSENEHSLNSTVPEKPIGGIFKCLPNIDIKRIENTLPKSDALSEIVRSKQIKRFLKEPMTKPTISGPWPELESTDTASKSTSKSTKETSKTAKNISAQLPTQSNKTTLYDGVKCPNCSLKNDVSGGPTKSPAKVRVVALSKLRTPLGIAELMDKSSVDMEELFAKVEDLLKSDDEDANQAVSEDNKDADIVKDTVDEASNVDNWRSDASDMQKRLATPNGKELLDSAGISDDEELNESLNLEQMDDDNLAEMMDSEFNKLDDSIGGVLEMDKSDVQSINKGKEAEDNTKYSGETKEGGKGIPSIQEQLLMMQDFSDDDEDEEEKDRMQEFDDEEIPGDNSSDTALDGKDLPDNEDDQVKDSLDDILNMELPEDISEGGEEQAEDSLDDILNMELPEEDISDNEHDGKWEEISEDMESSVHTNISDEEL